MNQSVKRRGSGVPVPCATGLPVEPLERRVLFAAVPRPDHVVVVVEENKAAASVIGSTAAPYLNGLAAGGASFTQSFGVTHPSQPNYLALFSGGTQGVTSDALPAGVPFTTPNLAAALRTDGATFAGFSEGLPDAGLTTNSTVAGGYRRKHNPWVNWQSDAAPTANQLPSSINRAFSAFPTDYATLPNVSFVVPNQYHDGHDDQPNDNQTPVQTTDAWLKSNLGAYATWAKSHNSLLVVTWDEDDTAHGNQIATIVYGQHIKVGTYAEHVTHYNLLRTITDMFAASAPGAAATTTPIADSWDATGTVRLAGSVYGTPGANGNTVAKATDNNVATFFDAPAATGGAVGIDLGSAKAVGRVGFAPRAGFAGRMVGGVVQASNDVNFASGVVTVATVTATPATGVITLVPASTSAPYRYWRYVGPANSHSGIAEFQLFATGTPTATRLTGTTYGTPGSYGNAGNTVAKATDGNLATFFDAPTATGGAVGIDLGSARSVTSIAFAPRVGFASRMVGGVFQASNDVNFASGTTTVYTITTNPASGTLTTVSVSPNAAYRYWRYVGPANGYCDIAEFQLFGT